MPELRWILLILGVAFLGALAWWEVRRQRRLPSPPEEKSQPRFREPTLTLPELRPRAPAAELPVVEIDDSMIGLRVDGLRIEEDMRASEPVEVIVEWPPEEERKLLSVRLMAQAGERFAGSALRQALAAEGFMHGKFGIFHKPGPDARVVVSAASMTQPGSFDLETMDAHRYGGLSLFAVLPGPLPDEEMSAALITAAQALNQRLEGVLHDERTGPSS